MAGHHHKSPAMLLVQSPTSWAAGSLLLPSAILALASLVASRMLLYQLVVKPPMGTPGWSFQFVGGETEAPFSLISEAPTENEHCHPMTCSSPGPAEHASQPSKAEPGGATHRPLRAFG